MSRDGQVTGRRWLSVTAALCVWASCGAVFAQTGVSDDRVSLPEGPGSLEGVGENVDINTNMGSMSHSVKVVVPQGFGAVTPDLTMSYSSGGGESVVGVGWSMPMPSVERMTFKRLPLYQSDDDFCANGSDQLIRQPGTEPAIYRSRFEAGFVRYTWMDEGEGDEGYWVAEYPDGTKAYFGATAGGVLVPEARVGGEEGTFKYMMVEKVDVYGHREVWTWQKFGHYSLPTSIGYVFVDGDPTYEIDFDYEERSDDDDVAFISSADGGFNLLLTQRLSRIDVKSRGNVIRQYQLTYEPYRNSGGFTRLTRVETKGAQGGTYPIVFDFEYSQALGGLCDGVECTKPFMVDMGATGVTVADGSATLLDINGDALPDIIDAGQPGFHRFFINEASEDGTSGFVPQAVESAVGRQDGHRLGQATVQVLDVNGDGFTDLINASTGSVLINKGNGDWEATSSSVQSDNLANALSEDFDPGEGGLQSLRFIDFNNDKLIDMMRATRAQTVFFENRGEDGFEVVEGTTNIEAGFEEDNLQLSDMNGDGQLDIVKMQLGSIQFRLNFGWGKWGDWQVIDGLPIGEGQIELAEMEDINGDALADLVVVVGESVTYALNNNSTAFEAPVTLTSADITGSIPNRAQEVTVLYADMNANGSSDVVWIGPSGQVDYLELFPVRPNLMTRITNAIGSVTDIEYTTVAQEMARDGGAGAWRYRLPSAMNIVKSRDQFDLLTDLHEITEYTYRDGFYDGIEKQFRGFERVETLLVGDETIEEGLTEQIYDVGAEDTYRNGLLLSSSTSSDGRELNSVAMTYEDCPVAELEEGLRFEVRHICMTETEMTAKEGLSEERWIVTRETSVFDGYGNAVESVNHGIVSVGGGGCAPCVDRGPDDFGAPCGPQCLGDEAHVEMDFVTTDDTNGRWIVNTAFRKQQYGRPGSDLKTETLFYFDGPDFVGLPLGQLDQAKVSRITEKVRADGDEVIETSRSKFDSHGNVVETLDPLGEPDGTTHRRIYTYDRENLRVVQAEILLEDPDGTPYRLRREVTYEPLFDKTAETTAWLRAVGGDAVSTFRSTMAEYDEFARITTMFLPGNTTPSPDERYTYDLQSPASRIITEKRSAVGDDFDLVSIQCLDGRGRAFQTRKQIEPDLFQISGLTRFNIRSQPVEVFQPFTSDSEDCDTTPPPGTLSTRIRYDSLYRERVTIGPDAGIYGTASEMRKVYEPLVAHTFDAEDTASGSPHFETPTTTRSNGLGQVTAIERRLDANGEPAVTTVQYTSLGYMRGYTDDAGNTKEQFFDLMGRVTRILDPNSAEETTYTYDDASNVVRQVDDRGIVTIFGYDGVNRPIVKFDEADEQGTRIEWRHDFDPGCPDCTHAEGNLASVTYPGLDGERASDHTGYDLRVRKVLTSRRFGGLALTSTFEYDNADRLIQTNYPDNTPIQFEYDDLARLTGITGFVHTIGYSPRGLMDSMGCADGTATTMVHDDALRLEETSTVGSSGVLQGFAYSRDRLGNILQIDDLAPEAPAFDATHTYDAWYRVRASAFDGESLAFEMNTIDNVTAITSSLGAASPSHVGDLEYNSFAPNAVTDAAGMIIGYDASGNVDERGPQRYGWDFMNRMTRVTQDGQTLASFVYGADQSRVLKREADATTIYTSPTFEVRDGISSVYLKVGRHRVARVESDALATTIFDDRSGDGAIGAADALLAHTDGDASGPVLWSSVRRLMLETGPDGGVTYLHHDHLGNLTLATGEVDGEQVVLGRRAFDPLGKVRSDSSGYVDEYGFTGQEIDRSTGLVHFDWRYYDPKVGRFLSIDPAFGTSTPDSITMAGQSTTAYAYVGGNFINEHDPTGLLFGFLRGKKSSGGGGEDKSSSEPSAPTREDRIKSLEGQKQKVGAKALHHDKMVKGLTGDKARAYLDSRRGRTRGGAPTAIPESALKEHRVMVMHHTAQRGRALKKFFAIEKELAWLKSGGDLRGPPPTAPVRRESPKPPPTRGKPAPPPLSKKSGIPTRMKSDFDRRDSIFGEKIGDFVADEAGVLDDMFR